MHTIDGHGHQQGHGHDHGHLPHTQVDTSPTQGRLIRWARLYDPLIWLQSRGQTRKLRALPLDLAALRPGERVLDIGCGTGDVTLGAARRVGPTGAVAGIDAAPEMIDVARSKARNARGAGRAVRFSVEPVEALSFAAGSFDVVLSSMMMHHLPGDLKRLALGEVRRVLRPGGRIVIVDFQPPARKPHLWQSGGLFIWAHSRGQRSAPGRSTPAVETRPGLAALADLLRDTGFIDVEVGPTLYSWIGFVRASLPA